MTTEELIQKYPKIFAPYEGNPGNVNWYGVPSGWLPIIDKLCGAIQDYIDNTSIIIDGVKSSPEQITCIQMKEKYGGLRFYYVGGDDFISGMVRMAEFLCHNTCEDCGSNQDLGVTSGWITVLCRDCVVKNGDRAMRSWTPKK